MMPPSSFQNLEPAEDGFPAKRLQDGIEEDSLRSSGVYHHKYTDTQIQILKYTNTQIFQDMLEENP